MGMECGNAIFSGIECLAGAENVPKSYKITFKTCKMVSITHAESKHNMISLFLKIVDYYLRPKHPIDIKILF